MTKLTTNPLLVIFEMANNHMGDVDHGLKIIREIHAACRDYPYRFAFKFQYRELDTFIHPEFRDRTDVKYVKRFQETRLTDAQFLTLKNEAAQLGFLTMCTPFDEASVDRIEAHAIEIIKIASCSCTDWPLLERIVKSNKPVVVSTAGISLEDLDKVASFLVHRERDFAFMHCVAEYPTQPENLQLNQIRLLRSRYPNIPIGYSTHETPDNTDPVKIAIAEGATLLEKHVGVPTANYSLNAYSATPAQIRSWLETVRQTLELCGQSDQRHKFSENELASLRSLRRGVFAKRALAKGERITGDNVLLACPVTEGQVTANDLSKYTEFCVQSETRALAPILFNNVSRVESREKVYRIIRQVKEVLKKSQVVAPGQAELEVSHHYGLDRFNEYGITMITVVNRGYCKKLIIMLPGQSHPEQYHKVKEETFHVLWGDVLVKLNGIEQLHHQGDVVVIEQGVKHSFTTPTGTVIEEISSTHQKDDSFYTDPQITLNRNRKTLLTNWLE